MLREIKINWFQQRADEAERLCLENHYREFCKTFWPHWSTYGLQNSSLE